MEDDQALGWLIQKMLRRNYNIHLAQNGFEACAWLSEGNECDMIISDINMPHSNGLELIEHCSISGFHNTIPILVLTANPDVLQQDLAKQVVGVLAKPFDPKELFERIESTLVQSGVQFQ